jgi:ferredoxin-NADP reductase
MAHVVRILSIDPVTHDVHSFKVEKPTGYHFKPGQATEVAINKPGWQNEKRPFTFTSLNNDAHLEFIIKSYKDHPGMTNQLMKLHPGDELIIDDVWGAIEYKGPGYFIAGGAGITPFIAILRELARENNSDDNQLFFSNKTNNDIILKDELSCILKDRTHFIITNEPAESNYHQGHIDDAFIKANIKDFSKHFYVCGPQPMIDSINDILIKHGASPEAVVFEK